MAKRQKILANIPVDLKSIIKKPISVPPNTSILDARDILIRHRIGRLVVAYGKRPVGIVTENDLARSVSVFSGKPIGKIMLRDVMSKDLITLKDNATIFDCAKKMIDNDISSVVIKNSKGQLVGVVTKTDLVSTFLIESTASLPISKIMTRKIISV